MTKKAEPCCRMCCYKRKRVLTVLFYVYFAGYQAAYCQLAFAGSTEHDPFAGSIPDAKIYLANCLKKLSVNHPGKVSETSKEGC